MITVSPNAVLKIREKIRNFNIEENRKEYLKDFNRKALFCKPNLENY